MEKENRENKETNVENKEGMEENEQEGQMEEDIWTPLEMTQGTLAEMEEQQVKGNEEEKKETTGENGL